MTIASVADSNATTTRGVQDFTAADILASRLVFITTGGPTVPTRVLILLPGYPLLNGYPDARVPVDTPDMTSNVFSVMLYPTQSINQ